MDNIYLENMTGLNPANTDEEESGAKFRYERTSRIVDCDGDIMYTTYGVRAFDSCQNVVAAYPDVSASADFVQGIVDMCNKHGAHVIHLEDILLDSIG